VLGDAFFAAAIRRADLLKPPHASRCERTPGWCEQQTQETAPRLRLHWLSHSQPLQGALAATMQKSFQVSHDVYDARGTYVGADPDINVRFALRRDSDRDY
jgi:hypothetical protein